jgi:exopolysaccharide biosynthesis protein
VIPALPETLAPPAPFPLVIAQSHETEFVAPGIRRGVYRLQTTDGPIVVTVVAVDPREPTVRFETVLANDRMISSGETVSSMAHRIGAVAGVNADYFDIGQTNQPLNIVVRDGALLRTPSKRVALEVRGDRTIAFENVTFSGTVRYGATTLPVTTVNEWPPQGGVGLLTPAYGMPKPNPDVTLVPLVRVDEAHLPTDLGGAYRAVTGDPSHPAIVGPELAFGPAARALGPLPNPGDDVHVDVATTPALADIANAVGGGPLLVADGVPVEDPNAPAPEERDRRFPVSGAAVTAAGALVLVAVDGRRAAYSIGVTRPEFASLMLGFGATKAMAFDSGGSSTLVARVLGDADASVLNMPSDGEERPVADGLFVCSDAPRGPAAQLVVRPSPIVALPDASVPVTLALVDAAGHPTSSQPPVRATVAGSRTSREVTLRSGSTIARVRFDVVTRLAKLTIAPDVRDPDPNVAVTFTARGIDARGRDVALGDRVRWASDRGRFTHPGVFVAPDRDARVVASAGGALGEWPLYVGHHVRELALFDAGGRSLWRFDSAPAGELGSISFAPDRPEMTLPYDFTSGERAAYADADIALPGEPQSLTIEILGDASGVGVRAAFVNGLGERRALTLARAVDWNGWRPVTVVLPDDVSPPVRLVSLYVVDSLANAPTHAAGSLAFRHPSLVLAGNP